MADMISSLVESMGGPALEDLGNRFGLPPQMVKAAMPAVIGLILAGIKRGASQPGGADKLAAMMEQNTQRMGGRDLDTFIKEADPTKTADLLDSLTGPNSTENAINNLAGSLGVDAEALGGMMGVLAPAVVSQLGSMAQEQGLDAQGVLDLVDQNADALKGMGNLDDLLDNTPGIGNDIKRGLSKLFGR